MKPVLVVQHVAAEGPGAIGVQAAAAGLDLDVRAVWEDCSERASLPPTLRDHAALVIMGGPMAAHSDVGFSTRIRELALAREALERDLPTLGVCLGAQLIALAAGGQCYRGPAAEIGWYPIRFALAAQDDPLLGGLPDSLVVFHWHADTFSLPDSAVGGAVILAESDCYANQAFRVGKRVWGLQCHPEVDEATVVAMVEAGRDELDAASGADPTAAAAAAAVILDETPAAVVELEPVQRLIFARFAGVVRDSLADGESH